MDSFLGISNPKLVVIVGSLGLASNFVGLFLFHGMFTFLKRGSSLNITPIHVAFRTRTLPFTLPLSFTPIIFSCIKYTQWKCLTLSFGQHNTYSEAIKQRNAHPKALSLCITRSFSHPLRSTCSIGVLFISLWSPSCDTRISCSNRPRHGICTITFTSRVET